MMLLVLFLGCWPEPPSPPVLDSVVEADADTDADSDTDTDPVDADGDGFTAPEDCDDDNPAINPTASDIVGDDTDQNCDGVDGTDSDGDGFASEASGGDDCDDANSSVNPGATEDVYDGIDNDCDVGTLDDDLDTDGHANDTDCDDADGSVYPGASEVCGDGVVNDCESDVPTSQAYCRLQGSVAPNGADLILYGAAGDGVGVAVGSVEGWAATPTLLVSAPDAGDRGAVYFVPGTTTGSRSLSGYPSVVGPQANSDAGWGLAAGPDFDGDAVADVFVGAPKTGAVYLVSGPVTGVVTLEGQTPLATGYYLGERLTTVGDLDGDGERDVAVSAWGVATYLLSAGGTFELVGTDSQDRLGYAATGDDLDGDGDVELVVGAPEKGGTVGALYIFDGPVSAGGQPNETGAHAIAGPGNYSRLGTRATTGDLDNDGVNEIIVSAPGDDELGSYSGTVFLIRDPTVEFAVAATDRFVGAGSSWQCCRLSIGDFDGDGIHDLALGTPEAPNAAGGAWLFYGPISGVGTMSVASAAFHVESAKYPGNDYVGFELHGADADGDGADDLLIGASNSDDGGLESGAAYLFLGSGY